MPPTANKYFWEGKNENMNEESKYLIVVVDGMHCEKEVMLVRRAKKEKSMIF